jgi:hypothetical protein
LEGKKMNLNDLRIEDSATGETRKLTVPELDSVLAQGNGQINEEAIQIMAALVMWLAQSGYGTTYVTHRPPPVPLMTLAKAYEALDRSKTADQWMDEIQRFTIASVPGLADRVAQIEARREFGSDYE